MDLSRQKICIKTYGGEGAVVATGTVSGGSARGDGDQFNTKQETILVTIRLPSSVVLRIFQTRFFLSSLYLGGHILLALILSAISGLGIGFVALSWDISVANGSPIYLPIRSLESEKFSTANTYSAAGLDGYSHCPWRLCICLPSDSQ
jgi:hypothetical protein